MVADERFELRDRFGPVPDPLENLILLQQARIKLGQAGARAVTFRGGRLAVTPIELDSTKAKQIRAEIPEALYESGRSQLSVRVPDEPGKRFPAVVRTADVLLAVTREAESAPGTCWPATASTASKWSPPGVALASRPRSCPHTRRQLVERPRVLCHKPRCEAFGQFRLRQRFVGRVEVPVWIVRGEHQFVLQPRRHGKHLHKLRSDRRLFHRLCGDVKVAKVHELVVHARQLAFDVLRRVGNLRLDPRDVQPHTTVGAAAPSPMSTGPRTPLSALPA